MKRKIVLALLLALMLTLVGCNGCNGGEVASTPVTSGSASDTPTGQGTAANGDPNGIQGNDDGILDLQISLIPQEGADQGDGNADDASSTIPTTGNFNDPSNWVEVPLS